MNKEEREKLKENIDSKRKDYEESEEKIIKKQIKQENNQNNKINK